MNILFIFSGIVFFGFLWIFFLLAKSAGKHPFFMEKIWFVILYSSIGYVFITISIPLFIFFVSGLFGVDPQHTKIIGWFMGGIVILSGFLIGLGSQIDTVITEDMQRE